MIYLQTASGAKHGLVTQGMTRGTAAKTTVAKTGMGTGHVAMKTAGCTMEPDCCSPSTLSAKRPCKRRIRKPSRRVATVPIDRSKGELQCLRLLFTTI